MTGFDLSKKPSLSNTNCRSTRVASIAFIVNVDAAFNVDMNFGHGITKRMNCCYVKDSLLCHERQEIARRQLFAGERNTLYLAYRNTALELQCCVV